ncbi:STAS domain-containing protein [Nitrospirillum amazonense]|uniref:Anti-sigma-factor antagonist n=1 Tax=Nitrospirillum amazonense TaxID=28077 RepID=A0A560FJG3_9PROT|nr:STAS domain-containing protein [Nitrospirillum amazonense]MDG3439576.1 STAS domain-containing protein [Nitrospirillum amazonense]MEC4592380.1 STAS domain-containing protein [Nitrospirillum amazonense]TWB21736.1 anti-sigma-factor antagonist [Nitrospirillum amazonense]TWB65976.1 anti-sigma-factor antagonist [Nitrospirillum amazonense]
MLTITQANGTNVLTIDAGRLDAAIAVRFKDTFLAQELSPGPVLIDMTGVSFIDSSGLGALISIVKHLKLPGRPGICGLQPSVKTMFSLTRMDRVFAIYPDVATALATPAQ